jgi:hypothetical protein
MISVLLGVVVDKWTSKVVVVKVTFLLRLTYATSDVSTFHQR